MDGIVPRGTTDETEKTDFREMMLPNDWTVFIYSKEVFKRVTNRAEFCAKPHREVCHIRSLNDLFYLIDLMSRRAEEDGESDGPPSNRINLDLNDYIIMRKGIEPVWEDPHNSNGGTFTVKITHELGFHIWSRLVMYMTGETLTAQMNDINGIGVSFISDSHNFGGSSLSAPNDYTYIKIWDARPQRSYSDFLNILPVDIIRMIRPGTLKYTPNGTKKHFGQDGIMKKISQASDDQEYGGRGRGRHGYGSYDNRRGGRGGRGRGRY